jgi:hypothetical protein
VSLGTCSLHTCANRGSFTWTATYYTLFLEQHMQFLALTLLVLLLTIWYNAVQVLYKLLFRYHYCLCHALRCDALLCLYWHFSFTFLRATLLDFAVEWWHRLGWRFEMQLKHRLLFCCCQLLFDQVEAFLRQHLDLRSKLGLEKC